MLEKIANKIKAAAVIAVAGLVTMLVGMFLGRKSQWAKDKEREIEKIDREIKINDAEVKKKDKQIKKADQAVDQAKKDAEKAVHDYAELKKLHDEKIAKAGDNINEDIPEKYEKEEFKSNADVSTYFNELLADLHSSRK